MEQPRKSNRRLWIGAGVGIGGCLLIILLVCVAAGAFGSFFANEISDELQSKTATTWSEAATFTDLTLYEPTYLPEGSGQVTIDIFGVGGLLQTATATYESKLAIYEVNRNADTSSSSSTESVEVEGADEARWSSENAERTLNIRKGDTWIALSRISDDELLKVGASLRAVSG